MLAYQRVLEARHLETSAGRLRIVAGDEVRPVRLRVARNPNTPSDVLDALARDEDKSVRWNALLHPKTPDAGLRWLSEHEMAEYGKALPHPPIDRSRPERSNALRAELLALGAYACPKPCGQYAFSTDAMRRRGHETA
jgi:hypothetical protein